MSNKPNLIYLTKALLIVIVLLSMGVGIWFGLMLEPFESQIVCIDVGMEKIPDDKEKFYLKVWCYEK